MADELATPDSRRVAEARSRAKAREAAQVSWLRPFALVIVAIVLIGGTVNDHPAASLHGEGAGVTAALAVFVLAFAAALRLSGAPDSVQAPLIALMGAAGVALSALQPHGATGLAPATAVFMAVARLRLWLGLVVGGVITAGMAIAAAATGNSASAVLASTLLCMTLALMARFLRQSRASQAQTELLLAELEDARDAEAEAAALAERARIAGDLHDVLAHSLSGAAIQLQTARVLAERGGANQELRESVDRAAQLVKDGLDEARGAVGALRGVELPGVEQLPALVDRLRSDLRLNVELAIEGAARPLSAEAGMALYRGAQEALTNVARYAPGARTTVVLTYRGGTAKLTVADRLADTPPASANGLPAVGGGHGLATMRERIERAGGRMEAGATADGWRVELEVPA